MKLDFSKCNGLVPAIVQDHQDGRVLMLGFMDGEAFAKTVESGKVTFLSRTRNKLWTKGESSGHYLLVKADRGRLRPRHVAHPCRIPWPGGLSQRIPQLLLPQA